MRYVIYGAGAVGGTIAARLYVSGYDVSVIARGEHLARLQRAGLIIRELSGESRLELPAFGSPAEVNLRADDVIVLAMKSQDTVAAVEELAVVGPPGLD